MKKLLFLLAMIFTSGTAHATTQCIQFPTRNANSYTYEDYKPDWSVTWSSGFVAKGTSLCSKTSGTYAVAGDPTWASLFDPGEHKNCWCKLESPVVSAWVFHAAYNTAYGSDSAEYCASACASACAFLFSSTPDFRSALFGAVQ